MKTKIQWAVRKIIYEFDDKFEMERFLDKMKIIEVNRK